MLSRHQNHGQDILPSIQFESLCGGTKELAFLKAPPPAAEWLSWLSV